MASYLSGTSGIGPFASGDLYAKALSAYKPVQFMQDTAARMANYHQSPKYLVPTNPGYNESIASSAQSEGSDEDNNDSGGDEEDPYEEIRRAEEERAQAELEAAQDAYDQERERLEAQLPVAQRNKEESLKELNLGLSGYTNQVGSSKEEAQNLTDRNLLSALTTAKDVERKNRNVARGLGILNSSAAAELMQKPWTAYSSQRAEMLTTLSTETKRLNTLLEQANKENSLQVSKLEGSYADLINNINRDLRFNAKDKTNAIRQAQAALSSRMADINAQSVAFKQQVQQYHDQLKAQAASMGTMANTYNPAAIQGAQYTPDQAPNSLSASIYDPKKKSQVNVGPYANPDDYMNSLSAWTKNNA